MRHSRTHPLPFLSDCRYISPQENFDARLEPVGWQQPGFDASGWPFAAAVAPKTAPFPAPLVARPSLALAIAELEDVAPPLLVANYSNATFVDFGTDFSGGVCLDATAGRDGVRLLMRIGEEAVTARTGPFWCVPCARGTSMRRPGPCAAAPKPSACTSVRH